MAKKKKISKKQKPQKRTKPSSEFKSWHYILFAILFIIIVTMIAYADLAFFGMTPAGGDVISSEGKVQLVQEYEKKTGEESLWNPAIFSGMPIYHRYGPRAWSVDTLVSYFYEGKSGQVLVFYIVGALGMFFLLYSLDFSILISVFGAICFLFVPHYNSLWLAGHFSKFRAIMYIPWVVAAFTYLLNKKNILAMLLFTLAISMQVRTQHYQIIFYTWLLLFVIGIYPLIKFLLDKKYSSFLKLSAMILIGIVLMILTVFQPLLVMNEYTPYSTRGGNPVNIVDIDDSATKAKGVSFEYATKWSLSPKETITFLIPRYFGGTSHESYQGESVPQLKGRTIPGYWGDMPFTGSTDYIGIVVFVLMILGIVGNWKNMKIRSLSIFTFFAILLAFGRHFPIFYKLFFYNLPYFSKFRIPTMIMMAVFFVFILFAVYGLKYLIEAYKSKDKMAFNILYITGGFLLVLSLSPFVLKSALPFATKLELNQYSPQILNMLRDARFELMKMDSLRTLLFSILTIGVIFSYLKNYIRTNTMIIMLLILYSVDVYLVNSRFMGDLVEKNKIENQYFAKSTIDNYLISKREQDGEDFRVLGLGNLFGNNMLSYHHQCIGGYDAAKLQLIQDVIDNNIFRYGNYYQPDNWNIINMLNGKYVVSDKDLQNDNLELILKNKRRGLNLYQNKNVLPRAYFVGNYQYIDNQKDILRKLNSEDFNPARLAILETDPETKIAKPDSQSYAKIKTYTPNKIIVDAKTNTQTLLVLSEIYYPIGWKASVDGEETEIYKTNHLLRSIIVPKGEHEILFSFKPKTYINGKRIATVFNLLIILSIMGLLFYNNKKYFSK